MLNLTKSVARPIKHLSLMACIGAFASVALAQSPIPVSDSGVAEIDSATIGYQIRSRFDLAYGADKINRGEYIWASPAAVGNGPIDVESNVDYQTVTTYLEYALSSQFSVFVQGGFLAVNPRLNSNASGTGDVQAGFKYGLIQESDTLVTFQMKFHADNGDADRGLGTGHFSIEPGILFLRQYDCVVLEGELKQWTAIDGTDPFQGTLIQYGLGASTNLEPWGLPDVRPVVELTGWSFFDGQTRYQNAAGAVITEDASGDTIINARIGTRLNLTDTTDLYLGHGWALTDEQIYEDMFRVELRLAF